MECLIFINGSMNSGKTTTAKALAHSLGFSFIDFDDIRDEHPELELADAIPLVLSEAAERINVMLKKGESVVACYVLSEKNYAFFNEKLDSYKKFYYTLSPDLTAITQQRGERSISSDEVERIKHHYDIGINRPSFGKIINNTNSSVNEVIQEIIKDLELQTTQPG